MYDIHVDNLPRRRYRSELQFPQRVLELQRRVQLLLQHLVFLRLVLVTIVALPVVADVTVTAESAVMAMLLLLVIAVLCLDFFAALRLTFFEHLRRKINRYSLSLRSKTCTHRVIVIVEVRRSGVYLQQLDVKKPLLLSVDH